MEIGLIGGSQDDDSETSHIRCRDIKFPRKHPPRYHDAYYEKVWYYARYLLDHFGSN